MMKGKRLRMKGEKSKDEGRKRLRMKGKRPREKEEKAEDEE